VAADSTSSPNGDRGLTLRELVLELRADVKELLQDHENRIRSLERSRWSLAGIASVLGAVTGTVAGLFGN
jgi:hypothetical protein